jgi:hypothetical protein
MLVKQIGKVVARWSIDVDGKVTAFTWAARSRCRRRRRRSKVGQCRDGGT